MRAKRRGRLVYTERGPGAEIKPTPSPLVPVLVTARNQVIYNPPAVVVPEEVCPHGGLLLHDVPVCGICSNGGEEQIGLALMFIARKTSYHIPVASASRDDVMMVAALALVANGHRVLKAKNPTGMAFTIAKRAVLKMYRNRSVQSMGESQMNLPDVPELETSTQRLDFLTNKHEKKEMYAAWVGECYERVRIFPGIGLMWTAKNLKRLQEAIEEGKRDLPSQHWRIIDMRLGLSEGMKEHKWTEIADIISPSWKPIPEHQVRRAYHAGLDFLREHLVKTLMPENIFNSNKISAVDQISGEKIA
jgi:hypothetical protein